MNLPVNLLIAFLILSGAVVLSRWIPKHPQWRPLVIALNLGVTVRYLYWRGSQTLNWETPAGVAVSFIVYGAELYGFLVVLHHYLISTRSRERTARPPDSRFSPSVDVLIATYDEATEILYRTIVGCQAMDYPAKTIHVLDDGCRAEVRKLCRNLGVNYIGRQESAGAKAGNLNHALALTSADLVATFDADHVPVRTFLTETIGFFRDEQLAQVQTPHSFYNPDLFQDRLRSHDYITNEQDMFYHVVQPGRDAFNSSFYCGSGALFSRKALDAIGGFPETTVTEDLHTSVLLHSQGWNSVYLNRDLSAGLAPESFQAYVTQRRRWARGTLQVMLARKGLFLRGLTFMQRLNYLATLWYWFYGLPRLVYLVAPLFFLLAGIKPLVVHNLTDLLTYYLPHLAISIVGFQLVNLGMRRIFWSDIYESCIALHVALTALLFPFAPQKVHFTVTPKGQAARGPAPFRLALPGIGMVGLVVCGAVLGLAQIARPGGSEGGVVINTFWDLYNLVVLSFGLLLFRPSPRRRRAIRLARDFPLILNWQNNSVEGQLQDLSETGLSFHLGKAFPLPNFLDVRLGGSGPRGLNIRGRLVRCDVDPAGHLSAAVDFIHRSEDQHRRLVEMMFSAPDSWSASPAPTMGAPEHFARIIRSLLTLFSRGERLRRMAPRFHAQLTAQLQDEDGEFQPVTVTDISMRGAALRLDGKQSIPSPEQFKVILIWNQLARSALPCRIRNVRSLTSGERVIGVLFAEPTANELAGLRKQLYGEKVIPIRRGLAS